MEGWKSSRMRPSLCSHSLSHLATPSSYSVVFFVTSECLEYVNIQIYIYNTYCCMHWHTFFCKTGAWSWGLELCEIKSCWCVSKIEVPKIHWLPFRWIMFIMFNQGFPGLNFVFRFIFGDMHVFHAWKSHVFLFSFHLFLASQVEFLSGCLGVMLWKTICHEETTHTTCRASKN